jgi:hypothetical protein
MAIGSTLFNLQPTLTGRLLQLRPLRPDDYDALYAVASDPLIWEQHPAKDRCEEGVFKGFFQKALDSGGALVAIDCKNADYSPEPVLETALLMKAPEKNRCDESEAAPNVISLVRFVEQMSRKAGLFRVFSGQCTKISLQLRLRGGGRGIRTPGTVSRTAVHISGSRVSLHLRLRDGGW